MVCMSVRVTVCPQGLSPAVQQCIPQWRIPKPCRVTLSPPDHDDLSVESLQAGIEAALRHLSGPLLPLGSTIQLASSLGIGYRMYLRAAAAAIAATAPALPHVTVYPPPVPGGDRGMAELVALQPPLAHACILYPQLSEAHANVPWPWQSLRVAPGPAMPVEQLTRLPDPTGGQYEIACQGLRLSADEVRLSCQALARSLRMQAAATRDNIALPHKRTPCLVLCLYVCSCSWPLPQAYSCG